MAMYAASIVSAKMQELAQQKLINIENLKAKQIDLEKQKTDKENKKLLLDERAQNAKILSDDKKKVALATKEAKIKAIQLKLEKGQITDAAAKLEMEQAELEYTTEEKNIEMEYNQSIREIEAERKVLNTEINALDADIAANVVAPVKAAGIINNGDNNLDAVKRLGICFFLFPMRSTAFASLGAL